MTELVSQRTSHDCGPCCFAMLLGRSLDDVIAIIGDCFDPDKGLRRDQEALKRLGFAIEFENGEPTGDAVVFHRPWCITPEFYRSLAWGRRALVTVPSLNIASGWHMIYWDGRRVWDPSSAKTYAKWDELRPEEIVIFREQAAS